MPGYEERKYRKRTQSPDLVSFRIAVRETDLWISADRDLKKEATDLVFDCRAQIESYIRFHPGFSTTLLPYEDDSTAPRLLRKMIHVTRNVGVGPMASVAGAIAQYVGEGLLMTTDQVIVENGGDIFLKANREVTVSLLAGDSPLSEKLGILIPQGHLPIGICSSSATVGHSLSMGTADLACLLSPSAALADAAATAVGNRIKTLESLESAASWARTIDGITGGVVIAGDRMAAWGDVELVGI
ncbi:MAG: UPF0280 family protein [Desulfatiglans sp.]|jgi:ApbE superfamily uncharacterized protein (UPF0280 family)|nr:UPF0280 family protein [Desulfatiglans sp.]